VTYLPRLGVEFGARASASISRGSRRTLTICRGGLQTGASAASQAHGRVPAVFIEAHNRGKTSAEVRKGRFTVCFLTSSTFLLRLEKYLRSSSNRRGAVPAGNSLRRVEIAVPE
jgi:hypothetical protein